MGRFIIGKLICLCAALAACEGNEHQDIHGHIHVIVNRDDALVARAAQALAKFQTEALPQVETALHTARPIGRLRLVEVLGNIRHTETVALLRHFAVYDADSRVRRLAETTLAAWKEAPSRPLAQAAQGALHWMSKQRAQGLGPLVREE